MSPVLSRHSAFHFSLHLQRHQRPGISYPCADPGAATCMHKRAKVFLCITGCGAGDYHQQMTGQCMRGSHYSRVQVLWPFISSFTRGPDMQSAPAHTSAVSWPCANSRLRISCARDSPMKAGSATSRSDPSSSSSLSGISAHSGSGCQAWATMHTIQHAQQQYAQYHQVYDGTCKLGPQAISFLHEGGRSAALLMRIGPGALQILLQRGHSLALRLRGVPRAVQLLLQALCPLPSCSNIRRGSAFNRKFPGVMQRLCKSCA